MQFRLFFLCSLLLLAGFGCQPITDQPVPPSVADTPAIESTIYTSFMLNIHDWTEPQESIATVNRVLDLHEQYQLPLDVYLDDEIVQVYQRLAPELIQRLRDSQLVAISYHIRPPRPYYNDFHEDYFDDYSDEQLRATLVDYETHALDLVTGEPTDAPGGYQYLKELIGYPPYMVAQASGKDRLSQTLAKVYKDLGARMVVRHATTSSLGESANGLLLRPEDQEVKGYEPHDDIGVAEIVESAVMALPVSRPVFLNFKWHENNFYGEGSNWTGMYFATSGKNPAALDPPYDISSAATIKADKTAAQKELQWQRYQGVLEYVSSDYDRFTVVNAKNILDLIDSE